MPERPRYLLAKAERLTKPVFVPRAGGEKAHPYEWREQRERLAVRAARVAEAIASLPPRACPEDRSVGLLTLHPSYFAKSYFPSDLLRVSQLRPVGSRPVMVTPEKGKAGASTAIFVAGKRQAFAALADSIPRGDSRNSDLLTIEDFRVPTPDERLRLSDGTESQTRELALKPREFSLLEILARHPGQVFSRVHLLDLAWPRDFDGDERTVDVHIRRLRRELREPSTPQLIHTVHGVGYKLAAPRVLCAA